MQIALITGGYGFLGRAMARRFKAAGYTIVGVGHGAWAPEEAAAYGFDTWVNSPISVATLLSLQAEFDVVIHCAGTGSVSYSLVNPMEDFRKTVVSTLELLEYLRSCGSRAKVLYPSSAAV